MRQPGPTIDSSEITIMRMKRRIFLVVLLL